MKLLNVVYSYSDRDTPWHLHKCTNFVLFCRTFWRHLFLPSGHKPEGNGLQWEHNNDLDPNGLLLLWRMYLDRYICYFFYNVTCVFLLHMKHFMYSNICSPWYLIIHFILWKLRDWHSCLAQIYELLLF